MILEQEATEFVNARPAVAVVETTEAADGTEVAAAPVAVPKRKKSTTAKKKKKQLLERLEVCELVELPERGESQGVNYLYIRDLQPALNYLNFLLDRGDRVAVDLETGAACRYYSQPDGPPLRIFDDKGSEPFTSPIYLCALSHKPRHSVVLDMRELMRSSEFRERFAEVLETLPLVAHNSLFEQSFFMAQLGVGANFQFDTMLASQMLNAGTGELNDLGTVMKKEFDLEMKKEWQTFFLKIHPTSPFPPDAIAYAAVDTGYLLQLWDLQEERLRAEEMWHIWEEIEQPFMYWMALARIHGVQFDPSVLEDQETELAALVQGYLERFQEVAPDILINSPAQLLEWFQGQEVTLGNTGEETLTKLLIQRGVPVDPNEERAFTELVRDYRPDDLIAEACALILDYRGVYKNLGTYVTPLLNTHHHPDTGCIHPDWRQIQADTGRMACRNPNLQNIPSHSPYDKIRNCLVAPPGFKMAIADYSQMELRILAEAADEWKIIQIFKDAYEFGQAAVQRLAALGEERPIKDVYKDKERWAELVSRDPELEAVYKGVLNTDFHTATAALLFDVPPEEVTKDQRSGAKTINFAVPYGAEAFTIAAQSGMTKQRSQKLLDDYYRTYRNNAKYLKSQGDLALNQGYTLTLAGRKRYYRLETQREKLERLIRLKEDAARAEEEIKMLQLELKAATKPTADRKLEIRERLKEIKPRLKAWEETKKSWKSDDPSQLAFVMARAQRKAVERAGKNHPIQGSNADITKLATVLAGPRLRDLHPDACILMWVHDEIVAIAPDEVIDQAAEILKTAMIEAGERYIKKVPVEIGMEISQYWKK